jgi:hypothetical protein
LQSSPLNQLHFFTSFPRDFPTVIGPLVRRVLSCGLGFRNCRFSPPITHHPSKLS